MTIDKENLPTSNDNYERINALGLLARSVSTEDEQELFDLGMSDLWNFALWFYEEDMKDGHVQQAHEELALLGISHDQIDFARSKKEFTPEEQLKVLLRMQDYFLWIVSDESMKFLDSQLYTNLDTMVSGGRPITINEMQEIESLVDGTGEECKEMDALFLTAWMASYMIR